MPYTLFTEEQKEMVRQTDLAEYLKRNGYKLKPSGSEYEWESPEGKVTIRGNSWYHQYEMEGGYVISFFKRFFNMEYQETSLTLLQERGIRYEPQEKKEKKKEFVLPARNSCMKRVFGYLLNERFLDRDVVAYFVKRNEIFEDEEYHNAIFVGRDEEGIPRHAHKRGTGKKTNHKGNVENSDPKYSFHYLGKSNKIFVFEAPIDMLSFMSLYKENWKDHSYVSLCSTAPIALVHILENNKNLTEVYPCLDYDPPGIEGDYRIAEAVRELGEYKVVPKLPKYKDWNEVLKAKHGITPIEGKMHPGVKEMKQMCKDLVKGCTGINVKNLYENLLKAYEKLTKVPLGDHEEIMLQSYEVSWIAFLLGKEKLASMEKGYTDEQYAKMLHQMYPPHKDRIGYKSRISHIGEQVKEIAKFYKEDRIVTESEQMKMVRTIMQLAVDGLRFYRVAEQNSLKQEEGEVPCQVSQASS